MFVWFCFLKFRCVGCYVIVWVCVDCLSRWSGCFIFGVGWFSLVLVCVCYWVFYLVVVRLFWCWWWVCRCRSFCWSLVFSGDFGSIVGGWLGCVMGLVHVYWYSWCCSWFFLILDWIRLVLRWFCVVVFVYYESGFCCVCDWWLDECDCGWWFWIVCFRFWLLYDYWFWV